MVGLELGRLVRQPPLRRRLGFRQTGRIPVRDDDQVLLPEVRHDPVHVGLGLLARDVVAGDDRLHDALEAALGFDQRPDRPSHPVHAVVDARCEVDDDGLPIDHLAHDRLGVRRKAMVALQHDYLRVSVR
jgi:hypothetical protein